jgi:ABC-type phosphate transport system auxiliary subunit
MKKILGICLLSLPLVTAAQNYGGMDEAAMQKMMQQAQGMQTCMENIDQAEMEAFQNSAEKMDADVKALCAAGKRDAAMARAMSFGREAASNKAMQQMRKCGEGMQNMMPKSAVTAADNSGTPARHICDDQ